MISDATIMNMILMVSDDMLYVFDDMFIVINYDHLE
jgi:hypothetical protein